MNELKSERARYNALTTNWLMNDAAFEATLVWCDEDTETISYLNSLSKRLDAWKDME